MYVSEELKVNESGCERGGLLQWDSSRPDTCTRERMWGCVISKTTLVLQ